MLENDNYEKRNRIRRVLRAAGAERQVAVLFWGVEMGLFAKGLLSRDLGEVSERSEEALWRGEHKGIGTQRWELGTG